MILITMHFGEGAFSKHLNAKFDEIHDEIHSEIKQFLKEKLPSIKDDYINLIMMDDDASVTRFENKKVIITTFLPAELDFEIISSVINMSLEKYIKKEAEVQIASIEIAKSKIYKKL
jgi:predicted RNA methylase